LPRRICNRPARGRQAGGGNIMRFSAGGDDSIDAKTWGRKNA